MQTLNKREFLRLGAAAGVSVLGIACGVAGANKDASLQNGNEDGGATDNACSQQDPRISIDANHGHVLELPRAHVEAGQAQTYSIQGTALHSHDVTVSAQNFASLALGNTVIISSSDNAFHTHQITVRCMG